MAPKTLDPRIAIVGAGPGGLLTAHYLKERGYRNVVVLEKLGRVGGLCDSVTVDGHCFDLGANYVTPDYTEILKLAKKLDVSMYSERPFIAMNIPKKAGEKVRYESIFRASRTRKDGSLIPLLSFGWSLLRYTWIRWRLSSIVDQPTFAGVAAYENGALGDTLEVWLEKNRLTDLERVFQLPITLMGFGYLDEIAAIYALKFMTVKSFVPMFLKETPVIGRFVPWPKRFLMGYQRFFQRLSWGLDVRTNVDIKNIARSEEGVTISCDVLQQNMAETDREPLVLQVDHLVIACPLNNESILKPLHPTPEEDRLFKHIEAVSYCMTTRGINLNSGLGGGSPLAAAYPVPELGTNVPYGVAKQWPDSAFAQFYTRTESVTPDRPHDGQIGKVQQEVEEGVDLQIGQMDGTPAPDDASMKSFNRFDYFQHVPPECVRQGWYDDLEAVQGSDRTFYVGGATNLELIEPIAMYTKNLVAQNFPVRQVAHESLRTRIKAWYAQLGLKSKRRVRISLALLVALTFVYIFFMPLKSVPIPKPISMKTHDARTATEYFWTVIHADAAEAIPKLLAKLKAAYDINPEDATLTAILGGTHLWRFHLRQRIGSTHAEQKRDLELAIQYGEESISLDDSADSTAPSLTAAARWQYASLVGEPQKIERIQLDSLANSIVYPAFAGFVQGWMFAGMLDADNRDYEVQALEGYHFMMSQCAGFSVSDDLKFNKLIHTFYGIKSLFTPVCYNNPLAPHSIEGTFIGYGDAFLKNGDLEKARLWYENTKTSPTYSTWKYQKDLEYRLAHLEELSAKFAGDSGKVDIEGHAMNFQSDIGCGSCHTK